jgi:hypothetical protein
LCRFQGSTADRPGDKANKRGARGSHASMAAMRYNISRGPLAPNVNVPNELDKVKVLKELR